MPMRKLSVHVREYAIIRSTLRRKRGHHRSKNTRARMIYSLPSAGRYFKFHVRYYRRARRDRRKLSSDPRPSVAFPLPPHPPTPTATITKFFQRARPISGRRSAGRPRRGKRTERTDINNGRDGKYTGVYTVPPRPDVSTRS